MHLYLIGYRGSGKSTIAKRLSERLGLPWLDTDALIEQAAGCTIREIFEREGESGFRDREQSVIEELTSSASTCPNIVALGGGAILRAANREAIARSGRRIWLTASPQVLHSRIQGDQSTINRRPALSKLNDYEEVVAILGQREPLYRQVAQKTVDTEALSAEAICAIIADWVRSVAEVPT